MTPRPRFFVVRPGFKRQTSNGKIETLPGPIVPLIAVDELPEWLSIVGIPRELAVEQTVSAYATWALPPSPRAHTPSRSFTRFP